MIPPKDETLADPMARYRDRWGSWEAEIVDVSFQDMGGNDRLLFATGEPMTVVMHYHAHERIENPMFGLAIYRADGLQISGPNNVFADLDIPFIQGEGQVRYTIDRLPLLEGTFYVTAAIHDREGSHTYDHRAVHYKFRVHPGEVMERYGVIYVPGRWQHVPSSRDAQEETGG